MKHAPFHQADAVEQRRVGMAECGWRGLSDGWMLRHLGDLHWRLIAAALGQQTTIFAAAEGAPVYAAFCVISERILHPARARPGAMMTIAARLRRLSPKRLVSFHHLSIGETLFAEVTMFTAFVRHGEASGNAISAARRRRGIWTCGRWRRGRIAALSIRPPGSIVAGRRRSRYRGTRSMSPPCPQPISMRRGCLYCANYPALADRAEWQLRPDMARRPLVARDIVYLGMSIRVSVSRRP